MTKAPRTSKRHAAIPRYARIAVRPGFTPGLTGILPPWSSAILAVMLALCPMLAPAASAAASGTDACFEQGDPKWADMRAEAEAMVGRGELSREKAEIYKCDPRMAQQDLVTGKPPKVVRLSTPSIAEVDDPDASDEVSPNESALAADLAAKKKKRCVDKIGLIHEIGSPVAIIAKQTIAWCFDGKKVSSWHGECTGEETKWGKAIYWKFDSCSQNDWIPYTLNGKRQGGIHHKTKHFFVNKTPWTYDLSTTLEQWGHYDGTLDRMVDGRLCPRCSD